MLQTVPKYGRLQNPTIGLKWQALLESARLMIIPKTTMDSTFAHQHKAGKGRHVPVKRQPE